MIRNADPRALIAGLRAEAWRSLLRRSGYRHLVQEKMVDALGLEPRTR